MMVVLAVVAFVIVFFWVMFYGDDSVLGQVVGLLVLLAEVVFVFILLGLGLGWI